MSNENNRVRREDLEKKTPPAEPLFSTDPLTGEDKGEDEELVIYHNPVLEAVAYPVPKGSRRHRLSLRRVLALTLVLATVATIAFLLVQASTH